MREYLVTCTMQDSVNHHQILVTAKNKNDAIKQMETMKEENNHFDYLDIKVFKQEEWDSQWESV